MLGAGELVDEIHRVYFEIIESSAGTLGSDDSADYRVHFQRAGRSSTTKAAGGMSRPGG